MKEPTKFWVELNAKLDQKSNPLPGLFSIMILTHYGLGWEFPTWLWVVLIVLYGFVICAKVGIGALVEAYSKRE